MVGPNLEAKLERIVECAFSANSDEISRSLLHAYIATLNLDELIETAIRTIDDLAEIRPAVRSRLAKVGHEGRNRKEIDRFGERLMALTVSDVKAKVQIDTLLAKLYHYFSPSVRHEILKRWQSTGTRREAARWIKAMSNDELLFNLNEILAYWRATGDASASKVIAYRADPGLLSEILTCLVSVCDEGWIVSRAALRANSIPEECWDAIRSKFPASYAYLCAKTGRSLDEDEALRIVVEAGATWPSDDRGLAIWAVGQLGMWSVLETILKMGSELRNSGFERRIAAKYTKESDLRS